MAWPRPSPRSPTGAWSAKLAPTEISAMNRRLAAMLMADVVGYSRLMGADEEGTLARAARRCARELIDPADRRARRPHRQDRRATACWSSSPASSTRSRCAVDVQRAMAERNAGVAERPAHRAPHRHQSRRRHRRGRRHLRRRRQHRRAAGGAGRARRHLRLGARSTTRSRGKLDARLRGSAASSSSRTSPGRCASTGCGRRVGRDGRAARRRCRCRTSRRSPCCRSRT